MTLAAAPRASARFRETLRFSIGVGSLGILHEKAAAPSYENVDLKAFTQSLAAACRRHTADLLASAVTASSNASGHFLNQTAVQFRLTDLSNLPHNWNGYGAVPVDPGNIQIASKLIMSLPCDNVPTPRVVPMTKGRLQFEWDVDDRSLELEVTSPSELHYLKWQPAKNIEEEGTLTPRDSAAVLALLSWVVDG